MGIYEMASSLIEQWRQLRRRYWISLIMDVGLIVAVLFGVHAWQTRDLPIDRPAPDTMLAKLDGDGSLAAVQPGAVGVVYFFAPWCFYCRNSIDNLDTLVASGRIAWGTAVALDYGDADEVRVFVDRAGLSAPVLMGQAQTAADWGIRAFPTYYVVDARGHIASRSVGYSTYLGMAARVWMAD